MECKHTGSSSVTLEASRESADIFKVPEETEEEHTLLFLEKCLTKKYLREIFWVVKIFR